MAAEKKNGEDLGPKAGAQLGKIVNLMSEFFFLPIHSRLIPLRRSVDANTVSAGLSSQFEPHLRLVSGRSLFSRSRSRCSITVALAHLLNNNT
jgi:hypothetical protein